MIYYSRHNFSARRGASIHNFDLVYPQREKRAWDFIVTAHQPVTSAFAKLSRRSPTRSPDRSRSRGNHCSRDQSQKTVRGNAPSRAEVRATVADPLSGPNEIDFTGCSRLFERLWLRTPLGAFAMRRRAPARAEPLERAALQMQCLPSQRKALRPGKLPRRSQAEQ